MVTIITHLASRLPKSTNLSDPLTDEQKLRFLSRLSQSPDENGCTLWGGRRNSEGGRITINNADMAAHRVAWMVYNGPIPPNLQVRHSCNKLLCMTPAHLYLAEPPVKKVKEIKPHGNKKLSDEDILSIRMLRSEGRTLADIALLYHVTPPTIYNVCKGITRRNVPFEAGQEPKQLP